VLQRRSTAQCSFFFFFHFLTIGAWFSSPDWKLYQNEQNGLNSPLTTTSVGNLTWTEKNDNRFNVAARHPYVRDIEPPCSKRCDGKSISQTQTGGDTKIVQRGSRPAWTVHTDLDQLLYLLNGNGELTVVVSPARPRSVHTILANTVSNADRVSLLCKL